LPDVPDIQALRGFRHDLHDSDGPDRALHVLVEPGFLEALRPHQQVVHLELVAVLLEEPDERQELRPLGLRGSISR